MIKILRPLRLHSDGFTFTSAVRYSGISRSLSYLGSSFHNSILKIYDNVMKKKSFKLRALLFKEMNVEVFQLFRVS